MDNSLILGSDELENEASSGWAPSDEGPTGSENEFDSDEVLLDQEDIVSSSFDDTELISSVQALTESNELFLQTISDDLKTNNELLSAFLIALVAFFALSVLRKVYDFF